MSYYLDSKKLRKVWSKSFEEIQIVISVLSIVLNSVHQTNHSERYWSIVLTPWIRFIVENYNHYVLDPLNEDKSKDFIQFNLAVNYEVLQSQLAETDFQSQMALLLPFLNSNNIRDVHIKVHRKNKHKKYNLYFQIISIYNYIIKFVVPARKIIFIDFILSPSLFFNIIFKLRLLPFLILRDEFIATKNVDLDFREDLFNKIKINKASSGLSSEFWKLLCVSMPLSYVEEFQEIVSYGSKVYGHPVRVILLRNIYSKDSSKIWVADALQRGSKLAISQHGGGYGLSEYDFNSYHEAGVADLFLSWYKSTKKNVIQVPSFKYIKSTNRSKKSYGLLVNCTWAKVFHHYGDSPIGEQVQKNTDDQIIFLNHLQGKASENMRVRQSHDINNYENIIKQYEKSGFQSLVENNIKFNHLILEAKIVVISCIGTVWLETLMNNIPTVVFFDPLVCYFNPKVNNYIEKFKKFGIIHNSPKSAAQHINNIYPDIEKWWNDPELQSLRQEFCRDFGVTEKTWARKYIAPINSILD